MSKKKMLQARKLIEQKNYAAARKILKTVDHPKAREWEARLDKIAPGASKASGLPRMVIIGLGVVILLAVIAVAVLMLINRPETPAQISANPTLAATTVESSPVPTPVSAVPTQPVTQAERPARLPDDFPFPAGGFSQVFDLSQGDQLSISVYSPLSYADLEAYFRQALPEAGYEVLDYSGGNELILAFLGHGSKGSLRLTSAGPGGQIEVAVEMQPTTATSLEELSTGGVGSTAAQAHFATPDAAARAFIEALTRGDTVTALGIICEANKLGYNESDLSPAAFGMIVPGGVIDPSPLVYTVVNKADNSAQVEVSGQLNVTISAAGVNREVPVPLDNPVTLELQNVDGWKICSA